MGGRSEVRRRGGGAGRGREYEARMECGFDSGSQEGGDWDEYSSKEMRKGGAKGGGGPSKLVLGGACVLVSVATLLITATFVADDDEGVGAAAMRLVGLG